MGFDALLGNERLKQELAESLSRDRVSHFYLICGPKGSGKHTLAQLLAAAILCRGENRPCGVCPACRKIADNAHPDYITVDDPEKKTVPVELIRQARADIYVRPNESDHKIYLFPRAQDIGLPGQNALLKVLEEPPEYGVFLLLTDNPEKLLPTVRSRCTELRLSPLPRPVLLDALRRSCPDAEEDVLTAAAQRSGGFLGQALELARDGSALPESAVKFAECFAAGDDVALLQLLVPMERQKRDVLIPALTAWAELIQDALTRGGTTAAGKRIAAARSPQELDGVIATLRGALDYLNSNVSPAAVCGYLEWALR